MRISPITALCLHLLATWLFAQTMFVQVTLAQAPPLPLHARIDQLVEGASVGAVAPLANDADFVRRVYLDLTGIVPSVAEVVALMGC